MKRLPLTSVALNMPTSRLLQAKRAFVRVLLSVAASFRVPVSVNRDSPDDDLLACYRKVILKAHPDKGGSKEQFQRLQHAKEAWGSASVRSGRAGRPPATSHVCLPLQQVPRDTEARVRGLAVLLTYSGEWSVALWREFVIFVKQALGQWDVVRWCSTLEMSGEGNLHVHLVLQFQKAVDRSVAFFLWDGRHPNASSHDLLGQGLNKNPKMLQSSVDRGFFYVWADKEGTQRDGDGKVCVDGNHVPSWVKLPKASRYQVLGKWPQTLWQQHKLSHDMYEHYLFQCRDCVVSRKRNLDAVRQRAQEDEEEAERLATVQRVHENTYAQFPHVPVVDAWLDCFSKEVDRYPFLVIHGPSRTRKTEFAKSLFNNPLELKIGTLAHFPEGMRAFNRKKHDAVVLDDCRDFAFLVHHQEKLQGKSDARVEFASTPGGQCSYVKWLHRVPIVVTANYTTANRQLLDIDDFLGNRANRVLLAIDGPLQRPSDIR